MNASFTPFSILAPYPECMVYGYEHCHYRSISHRINTEGKKKCYNYATFSSETRSLSNRFLVHLPTWPLISLEKLTSIQSKMTLVSVIIENMLRKDEGRSLIPIIFCLTSSETPRTVPLECMIDKRLGERPHLGAITHSELRRAYKLLTDQSIPAAVRQVAKETFKFAHVIIKDDQAVDIIPAFAPWEGTNAELWQAIWNAKKPKIKKTDPGKPEEFKWRDWLNPDSCWRKWFTTDDPELREVCKDSSTALWRIRKCMETSSAELNLSNCKLTKLPSVLWKLRHLKKLILTDNQISELPPDIGKLCFLEELHLNHMGLESLPAQLFDLENLKKLIACENRLTSLPPEIKCLTKLEELDLSSNPLDALPNAVFELPKISITVDDTRMTQEYKASILARLEFLRGEMMPIALLPSMATAPFLREEIEPTAPVLPE